MTSLVIASYNIHRGVGLDRRLDLDRIADVIEQIKPDVIGLQEVTRDAGAAGSDQAAYLARRLEMTLVMGETKRRGTKVYGNAVLTHLSVLGSERYDLSWKMREPRGCLRVDLDVDGVEVHLFTLGQKNEL